MCIRVSASTTLVFVAFSTVNFVFPLCKTASACQAKSGRKGALPKLSASAVHPLAPAEILPGTGAWLTLPDIRPMQRDRCSPRSVCAEETDAAQLTSHDMCVSLDLKAGQYNL